MTLGMFLQTLFEIIAAGFIIWGLFNEQKLVKFEDKIKAAVRRRHLKAVDNKVHCSKHCA